VLANPPFSLKNWGYEEAQADPFHRFPYGVPPKSYGDLAFVCHMVASLNAKGKMGTVIPHGVLFRGGAESKIRKGFVKDDLIEAIIGLPANIFYGTSIPAALLIINKNKPQERKGKILFIDASQGYVKDGNKNKRSSPYLCVNSPSVRIPHSFPRRGRRRKHAPCSPSLAVWHAPQRIAGQFNSVLSNCLSRPNGTLRGFDRLR